GLDITDILVAVISAVIALIVSWLANRQSRSQFFSTTISRARMEWIKEMRALCADLCASRLRLPFSLSRLFRG
ncbi:MAG: hypothetical protein ILO42_01730, partial [Clostridia bacterium]|nr:hypothetical protein [Clostridia bacterium]